MCKVVQTGFVEWDYVGPNCIQSIQLKRVELAVHTYRSCMPFRPELKVPFWSVRVYEDEKGTSGMNERFFQDYEEAAYKFHQPSIGLRRWSVGVECPKCAQGEAMYHDRTKELHCMNCEHKWKPRESDRVSLSW